MEPWERNNQRKARLETLAKDIPLGSWFLASKKDGAPEETWTLVLTGANLQLLTEASEYLAWKYREAREFRYVIVEGETGKIIKYPFRAGFFVDPV